MNHESDELACDSQSCMIMRLSARALACLDPSTYSVVSEPGCGVAVQPITNDSNIKEGDKLKQNIKVSACP